MKDLTMVGGTWGKFQTALNLAGYGENWTFWWNQFNAFLDGDRGPDMHDFTLVWMSENA